MEEQLSTIQIERRKSAQASVFRQMYVWMSMALAITGFTAFIILDNDRALYTLLTNQMLFWGLIIAEFVLVFILSGRIHRMSMGVATTMFIAYSLLNGVTMSLIFIVYTSESIASTFFITAGTFGLTSLYGYFTKRDLSSLGGILAMAIIGLIIASVVNIFMNSSTLYWIITYIGVLVFVGLTAYDTQKCKEEIYGSEVTEATYRLALRGALRLYLDFVNMFIYLLRLTGDRR